MTNSRWLQILSLSTTLFASACVAESDGPDQTAPSADGTSVHMMPLHNPDAVVSDVAPRVSTLTNFGGPLLKNISVHPVFWNANTQFQPNINAFYNGVTASPLWSMLAQYSIGNGSGVAGINANQTTRNVSDATVQGVLRNLISARTLTPTANTYFPVHFPSGMSITAPDGSKSCVVFCAYHGTFTQANGINVNYGIIPDQGGGCAGGCGNNASRQNNMDSVASHELIEATTDPAVGLATVFGPPLGWYDQADNEEIGDLCNGQQSTTVGRDGVTYTIQTEFSNATHSCVSR
jgi:hypothetical protein